MQTSEKIDELAKALAKAQLLIDHAEKDSVNPHFKSKFASLISVVRAIKVPFSTNGLSYAQSLSRNGDDVVCTTRVMHESGQWIESSLAAKPKQNTPQEVGSCSTYLRRYDLMAMSGVAPDEDDDGNAATFGAPENEKQKPKAEAPKKQEAPKEPDWAKGPYVGSEKQVKFMNEIFKKYGVEDEQLMYQISDLMKIHQVEVKNLAAGVKECLELQRAKGSLSEYA